MTRDSLEKKLVDLRQQVAQLQATMHAVQGAIQFAEHLLTELDALEAAQATLPQGTH